jgi:hypothetical protein
MVGAVVGVGGIGVGVNVRVAVGTSVSVGMGNFVGLTSVAFTPQAESDKPADVTPANLRKFLRENLGLLILVLPFCKKEVSFSVLEKPYQDYPINFNAIFVNSKYCNPLA